MGFSVVSLYGLASDALKRQSISRERAAGKWLRGRALGAICLMGDIDNQEIRCAAAYRASPADAGASLERRNQCKEPTAGAPGVRSLAGFHGQ